MRIVVTGSTGFIGSSLVDELLRRGIATSVLGIDRSPRRSAWWADPAAPEGFDELPANLAELSSSLSDILLDADMVVHLAAQSSVDRSIDDPHSSVMNNVGATSCLLGACVRARARPLLLVSTDEVYGETSPPDAATESDALRPSNPYAASKAGSELLAVSFARTYRLPHMRVRLGNTYGPRQHPEKLIPRVIARALNRERIPIYGDGLHSRCWMHVADAVDALCLLVSRFRPSEVYNVGSSQSVPNITVARRILNLLNAPHSLLTQASDRPGHDRAYSMSTGAFRAEFGWTPRIDFHDGLRETVGWYASRHSQLASVAQLGTP